jgi:hypothetical protein
VIDAHGEPMMADAVVQFVAALTQWHRMNPGPMTFRRHDAAIVIRDDGAWEILPGAPELGMAREAVREALA